MPSAHTYMVSDKRQLATEDEITAAKVALETRFPQGYRDYVLTFGAGYLNGTARVLPPTEIVGQTAEFRDRLQFLYGPEGDDPTELFESGLDLLPPERLLECILLIDGGGGHEIIYHPNAPSDIFLLPHGHWTIEHIGHTVDDALDSYLRPRRFNLTNLVLTPEGNLVESPIRWFEPDRDKGKAEFILKGVEACEEVSRHIMRLAQERATSALCVVVRYQDDARGERGEVLHLFDSAYGLAVEFTEDFRVRNFIHIVFDADRRDEFVDALIGYCHSRARAQINDKGIVVPL